MRTTYAIAAMLLMAGIVLSAPAHADERFDCEKLKGDASIRACSAVIEAGTYDAADLATAYLNRGLEYFALRAYDQAIADYTAAIRLDAKKADVYNNRGNAYHVKRDYAKAIRDFNRAIALNPAHALAYNNRGIVYGDMGDYQRAIQDYDQAIAIHPAYASAYNNRGNIRAKQGDFRLAIQDYSQAIVLKPSMSAPITIAPWPMARSANTPRPPTISASRWHCVPTRRQGPVLRRWKRALPPRPWTPPSRR